MNCNPSMLNLSENEMLTLWKQRKSIIPERYDCSIDRGDGINLDNRLIQDMKIWYAQLLAQEDASLLPTENIASYIKIEPIDDTAIYFTLPMHCQRPLELKMTRWKSPCFTFHSPFSWQALTQSNEFMRNGEEHPICVQNGSTIAVFGVSPDDTIEIMRCVIKPKDNSYQFAESCLLSI